LQLNIPCQKENGLTGLSFLMLGWADDVLGPHGCGVVNDVGGELLSFCCAMGLPCINHGLRRTTSIYRPGKELHYTHKTMIIVIVNFSLHTYIQAMLSVLQQNLCKAEVWMEAQS